MRATTTLASIVATIVVTLPSHAIIVNDDPTSSAGNPAVFEQAPTGVDGWDHVGWIGFGTTPGAGATGVYIGDGWVLSAKHTGNGGITLGTSTPSGGTFYDNSLNGEYSFVTPGTAATADLALFPISPAPALGSLPLPSAPIAVGEEVVLIGTGVERDGARVNLNNGDGQKIGEGYIWSDDTRHKTWARATVTEIDLTYDGAGFSSAAFAMDFEQLPEFGTATDKDSGAAVLVNRAGVWELAGIIIAVEDARVFQNTSGDQVTVSHFGLAGSDPVPATRTIAVDLWDYRQDIALIIPEPASLALFAAGMAMVVGRPRKG